MGFHNLPQPTPGCGFFTFYQNFNNMQIDLATVADLERIKKEIVEEISEVLKKETRQTKKWIKTEEARDILKCSAGTLFTLKNNGTIEASKVGGCLYYNLDSIMKAFDKNIMK